MTRRRRKNPEDYVYHATFLQNLPGIAEHGLQPGGRSQYGEGYTAHSRGKVFVCEFGGLHFWMSKLEDIANAESDFDDEESVGWTPVGLRIEGSMQDYYEDRIGTLDSGYEAGFSKAVQGPDGVEVWNGSRWVAVDSVDEETMADKALEAAEREDGYLILDFDLFVPRKP